MAYSAAVAAAQRALNTLGFAAGKVDGLWGANTKKAVRNFRASFGLDPDPPGADTAAKYLDAAFQDAINISAFKKGVSLTTEVPPPPAKAGPLAPRPAAEAPSPAAPLLRAPKGSGIDFGNLVTNPWVLGGAAGIVILVAMRKKSTPQAAVAGLGAAAKRGYKVCWWHEKTARSPTCRTLSAKQHRTAKEAAETVLMQNPNARVQVVSPRGGGRGRVFHMKGGRVVQVRRRARADAFYPGDVTRRRVKE